MKSIKMVLWAGMLAASCSAPLHMQAMERESQAADQENLQREFSRRLKDDAKKAKIDALLEPINVKEKYAQDIIALAEKLKDELLARPVPTQPVAPPRPTAPTQPVAPPRPTPRPHVVEDVGLVKREQGLQRAEEQIKLFEKKRADAKQLARQGNNPAALAMQTQAEKAVEVKSWDGLPLTNNPYTPIPIMRKGADGEQVRTYTSLRPFINGRDYLAEFDDGIFRFRQPVANRQIGSACGFHVVYNALALNQLLAEAQSLPGSQITPEAIRNRAVEFMRLYRQTMEEIQLTRQRLQAIADLQRKVQTMGKKGQSSTGQEKIRTTTELRRLQAGGNPTTPLYSVSLYFDDMELLARQAGLLNIHFLSVLGADQPTPPVRLTEEAGMVDIEAVEQELERKKEALGASAPTATTQGIPAHYICQLDAAHWVLFSCVYQENGTVDVYYFDSLNYPYHISQERKQSIDRYYNFLKEIWLKILG